MEDSKLKALESALQSPAPTTPQYDTFLMTDEQRNFLQSCMNALINTFYGKHFRGPGAVKSNDLKPYPSKINNNLDYIRQRLTVRRYPSVGKFFEDLNAMVEARIDEVEPGHQIQQHGHNLKKYIDGRMTRDMPKRKPEDTRIATAQEMAPRTPAVADAIKMKRPMASSRNNSVQLEPGSAASKSRRIDSPTTSNPLPTGPAEPSGAGSLTAHGTSLLDQSPRGRKRSSTENEPRVEPVMEGPGLAKRIKIEAKYAAGKRSGAEKGEAVDRKKYGEDPVLQKWKNALTWKLSQATTQFGRYATSKDPGCVSTASSGVIDLTRRTPAQHSTSNTDTSHANKGSPRSKDQQRSKVEKNLFPTVQEVVQLVSDLNGALDDAKNAMDEKSHRMLRLVERIRSLEQAHRQTSQEPSPAPTQQSVADGAEQDKAVRQLGERMRAKIAELHKQAEADRAKAISYEQALDNLGGG
ncbi:hypothetical protein LTS18_006035 [Coniosporium uncinatum]|uniref:Uncharacterized protein n=1 Tax=Coniosporium uncinatum TaxID=93489 RepID=A0ACC3DY59_9PEZI|nr:hypothetical protein LTS18_006035 [Coniosporium uncinatum]